MPLIPRSADEDEAVRSTRLETSLSNLTAAFDTFLTEYKRDRAETWDAIKQLGDRGRITWPQIIASVGALIAVLTMGTKFAELYVHSRVSLVEESAHHVREVGDIQARDAEKIGELRESLLRAEFRAMLSDGKKP